METAAERTKSCTSFTVNYFFIYFCRSTRFIFRVTNFYFFLYLIGLQMAFLAAGHEWNLFMDPSFPIFQDELDSLLKRFYDSIMDSKAKNSGLSLKICLRESDLWQSQQLGVSSPLVLLFTTVYFNMKILRIFTLDQHASLSFGEMLNAYQAVKGYRKKTTLPFCPVKHLNFYESKR